MNIATELLTGARYLLRGFRSLWGPDIRRYTLLTILINVLTFSALIAIVANAFDSILEALTPAADGW